MAFFDFLNGAGDVAIIESDSGFIDDAFGVRKLAVEVGERVGLALGAVNSKRGRIVPMDFKGSLYTDT
jgi:hypothetical protein